jgi:hypothetical protein
MVQVRTNIGFQTRYKITAICSETELACSDTITVSNIVLSRGTLALGDATSYNTIALGTSSTPPVKTQTNLINPVSTLPLEVGTFEQNNIANPETSATSIIARTFIFKDFTFPANVRTLDLYEIGLVGRTRAVFDKLTIDQKTWVKVDLEIVYRYDDNVLVRTPSLINSEEKGLITYDITPIVFNTSPANDSGKGYGRIGALRSYIYDGVNPASSTYSNTLAPVITGTLHYDECYYSFHYTSIPFHDNVLIHGFVIRDTNNGIGFLIAYNQPIQIQEDDSLDITLKFNWSDLSETLPEPI